MIIEINTDTTNIVIPNADVLLMKDLEAAVRAWETRTYHVAVPEELKLTCNGRNGMVNTTTMAMEHMMLIRNIIAQGPKQEFLGNGKERETGVLEFRSTGIGVSREQEIERVV